MSSWRKSPDRRLRQRHKYKQIQTSTLEKFGNQKDQTETAKIKKIILKVDVLEKEMF